MKTILPVRRAVVLAGGGNERMGQLAPKSVLPVVNHPNVRIVMEKLHDEGLSEFFVNSHRGLVLDAAREGTHPSTRSIHAYLESAPIGTATFSKRVAVEHDFPREEPFLVVAADISHPTMRFGRFIQAFTEARQEDRKLVGAVAFVLRPYDEVIDRYPVAIIDENNRILKFKEKPRNRHQAYRIFNQIRNRAVREACERVGVPCLPVNASYYVVLGEMFDLVPEPRHIPSHDYDYGKYLFKRMPPSRMLAYFIAESVRRGQPRVKKEWIDMATPSDFWLANWLYIKTAPQKVRGAYDHVHNVYSGKDLVLDPRAEVVNSILGDNVEIGPGSVIRNCVIGNNCRISGAELSKSVVFNAFLLDVQVKVEESVVGGHFPLIVSSEFGQASLSRRLITASRSGKISIERLDIKPEDGQLAEACFEKLKFQKQPNER